MGDSTDILLHSQEMLGVSKIILTALLLGVFAVACVGQWSGAAEQEAATTTAGAASGGRPAASKSFGERVQNGAIIGQAVATIVAIGLGGFFAWRRGIIFRQEQPHITITHDITHRLVSPEYVHIEVAVTLHNSSRVKVEIRDGLFSVEQMAPVTDEYVEYAFVGAFLNSGRYESPEWPLLKEFRLEPDEDALVVEPGERVVATYEYFVPIYVESVLISTHFCNIRVMGKIPTKVNPRDAVRKRNTWFRRTSGSIGWTKITAHDIVKSAEPRPEQDGE